MLGMWESDIGQRASENDIKLSRMKEKAIKENDVIVFNSINLYEKHNKDVTVLIKIIKNLYNQSLS